MVGHKVFGSQTPSRRGVIAALTAGVAAATSAWAETPASFHDEPRAQRRAPPPAEHPPAASAAAPADAPAAAGVTPEAAMDRLMQGNARFVAGQSIHPNGGASRREVVAKGQTPFASVLACADSRVAPELLFDQGLGDLFVVRVAGNVVDDAILASLEYSVIHLGSKLIMVVGHERCGAVKATMEALDGKGSEEDADTKIGALAALIAPAVKAVSPATSDKFAAAVSLNALNAAAAIFVNSPPLRHRVLTGDLKIVAAQYDLDDGVVRPAKT